jgi:hypothetical protein
MEYEYLSRMLSGYQELGGAGAAGHARADGQARTRIPDWAIAALRPVADGSSPVRAVIHPLGFTCLPMERAGLSGVCVHLWSPRVASTEPTTSPVHAHSWRLTSYALFGTLENRLMRITDTDGVPPGAGDTETGAGTVSRTSAVSADPEIRRLIEVRSRGDADELVPTGRLVRCQAAQCQRIQPGDVYSMPAGAFHRTDVAPGAEAVTVALGTMVPGIADCSLGPLDSTRHEIRRRACDAGQTAATARIVLDRLRRASARVA